MRTAWGPALCCVAALVVGPAWAADPDKAQEVVALAIKAHGGAEALSRAAICHRSMSVLLNKSGKTFTFQQTLALPDRVRNDVAADGKPFIASAIQGDHGWQTTGGPPIEMGKDQLEEMQAEAYVIWLTTLAPLLKDGFALKGLGAVKVNDREAEVVQVTHKGSPEVLLYFDKSSHLLLKAARRAREAGLAVRKEYLFGDHKVFDGAKLPTRETVTIEGEKASEASSIGWKFVKSISDDVFKKP
jgi:hypothetical protein